MKAILTLKKADLIKKLEERKAEISALYNKQIAEIDQVLDARKDATTNVNQQAEWYAAVAEGLRSGEITLSPTGKLSGAPKRPTANNGGSKSSWGYYSTADLEATKQEIRNNEAEALKPVDTAIDLLNLSTDETVSVDSSDYQRLLSGEIRRYYA